MAKDAAFEDLMRKGLRLVFLLVTGMGRVKFQEEADIALYRVSQS